jgi:hypothetical protein
VRKRSGFIAAFVGSVVLGLLSYSFAISVGLPAAQRAAPLATIATGIALLAVAALAYFLQRKSFDALHVPSLGIHYKNPTMYPSTVVVPAEQATDVYAEYIMWNAGDVPVDLGKSITQLERVRGNKLIPEESFPVVLGKGQVCIWRQFTGDTARRRPEMSETHNVNRERAVEFLQNQGGNRHFLFAVTYFSKPPATLTKDDVRTQFVGFAYQAPDGDAEEGAKDKRKDGYPSDKQE